MCICILSESVREKLALGIVVLDFLLALFGVTVIGLAIFVKVHLESRMTLMNGYDAEVLPNFLITVGVFMFVIDLATAKLAYDAAYIETRSRVRHLLLVAVVIAFILVWFVLAGSILCFTHRGVIEDSLQNGFKSIMKKYKNDLMSKVTMDRLQQQFQCCGSNSYRDWFRVNWVNEDFLNPKHKDVLR